jgi:hypothetical protein
VQGVSEDRILYWPIIVAVGCPLTCVLVWATGAPVLVALIALFWACMGIRAAITCVAWFLERSWRRFWSTLFLAVTTLFVALNLEVAWDIGRTAGNYVQFFAWYPYYKAEIAQLPADKPRFKVWEWNDSTPCATGLAYDESDKTGSASGTRAEPFANWHIVSDVAGVPIYAGSRTLSHFYFVTICPAEDRSSGRSFDREK